MKTEPGDETGYTAQLRKMTIYFVFCPRCDNEVSMDFEPANGKVVTCETIKCKTEIKVINKKARGA